MPHVNPNAAWVPSERRRIGFGQIGFVARARLERLERVGLVNVKDRVELLWQTRSKVMTETLGLRSVDHADGPLEAWSRQRPPYSRIREEQLELLDPDIVKESFVTAGQRRPDA